MASKTLRRLLLFLAFIYQANQVYFWIQKKFPQGRSLKIKEIDNKIPFKPKFIVPYLIFYPYIYLPFLLSLRKPKKFEKITRAFLLAVTIHNLIYIFFQTTIKRPKIKPTDPYRRLVKLIYQKDRPLNLFPSWHVSASTLANLCLTQISRPLAYLMSPLTVAIVLSTVFIKQHVAVDILGGLTVAFYSFERIFRKR